MLFLLVLVAIMAYATMYYAYFPIVYYYAIRKNWSIVLGLPLLILGLFFSNWSGEKWMPLFLAFFLGTYVLPGWVIAWGAIQKKPWSFIYFTAHLPLLLLGLVYYTQPSLYTLVESLFQDALKLGVLQNMMGVLSSIISPAGIPSILVGMLIHELSFRLIVGAIILSKIKEKGQPMLTLKDLFQIRLNDGLIWFVLGGFVGMLYGSHYDYSFPLAFSITLLMAILPLYFFRGVKILWQRYSKRNLGTYFNFFLILLILSFNYLESIKLIIITLGLLNTWFEFNKAKSTEGGR